MTAELRVAAAGGRAGLLLRPWLAADMAALVAEMGREYPAEGLAPQPPRDEREAALWLAGQDQGWLAGDWLTFAVLEARRPGGGHVLAGHVGLRSSDPGAPVRHSGTAEIGYWTAAAARGRGVAPAAVRAVTAWALDAFAGGGLREIILVHVLGNAASCRVAEKAGYQYTGLSPARPPCWPTDAHIHARAARPAAACRTYISYGGKAAR